MTDLELEKIKLKETIKIIEKSLEEENENLKKLPKKHSGTREKLFIILNRAKQKIRMLERSIDNPYFSRIDFKQDGTDEIKSYYIGKHGISDGIKQIVTDWRAPISSLYYDSNVGKCSYIAPVGEVSGDLSLKRQFQIDKGELLNYFDVDLVMNDELLQKYLNDNNDSRLKNIVSTIQKEQNQVIREKLGVNMIVQGVAGSGKTTVALHRIAYLVYNYSDTISQDKYLVIGPNKIFLNYIKSVLPDLDVDGIKQYTFQDFALNYLDDSISVNSETKKINSNIAGKLDNDIDKFKSSMDYKKMIDLFLDVYYESLTDKDLVINDFKLIDKDILKREMSIFKEYDYSLSSKIELVIGRLSEYILSNIETIRSDYNKYISESLENVSDDKLVKERNKLYKIKEEIEKGGKSLLRKYFSKTNMDALKMYKLFLNCIEDYNLSKYKNIKALKKETLNNLKNKECDFTDLAPILYISNAISPKRELHEIKHIVVDEAQDLGIFNYEVLKNIFPNATFSIFGDLAQSIYDYKGVDNWEDVKDKVFKGNCDIINFNKSYRTTQEIMKVADEVASSISFSKSDVVVRHGDDITFSKVDSNDIPNHIINKIEEYKSKGYKTIGIISKTDLLSSYLNDDLYFMNYVIPNVSNGADISDESFNICTISNQLSKGLEFDCIIIADANETNYSSENKLDMKLLYVAITRALHNVDIIYSDELTKPLRKFIEKEKVKEYKKR